MPAGIKWVPINPEVEAPQIKKGRRQEPEGAIAGRHGKAAEGSGDRIASRRGKILLARAVRPKSDVFGPITQEDENQGNDGEGGDGNGERNISPTTLLCQPAEKWQENELPSCRCPF
jgi:hypothetical protein